jgi:hypothetical protein
MLTDRSSACVCTTHFRALQAAGGPPVIPQRAVVKDEEQPWFHGKMSRASAEALLKEQNLTNGLFLVRQSDRTDTDYALSFCYSQRAYHNRIIKQPDGTFKNTKGSSWVNLYVGMFRCSLVPFCEALHVFVLWLLAWGVRNAVNMGLPTTRLLCRHLPLPLHHHPVLDVEV